MTMKDQNSDDVLELLRAYKLPTIIISIGLVISVLCFQFSLNYEVSKTMRSFERVTKQAFNLIDLETKRHIQLIGSMSRLLGQVQDFSDKEFDDISESFIQNTSFISFQLYRSKGEQEIIKLRENSVEKEINRITKHLTSASEEIGQITNLATVSNAIEQTELTKKTYFSSAYQMFNNEELNTYAIIVAPIPERYRKKNFLVGIINLKELLTKALSDENSTIVDLDILIHDIVNSDRVLIFDNVDKQNRQFLEALGEKRQESLALTESYHFSDHWWQIKVFTFSSDNMGIGGVFPWVIFMGGLLVTGLISYIIFRMTTDKIKTMILIEEQTADLRQYAQQLEMNNRDLDDFVHIASHDLKEPLRGMYNYAEFLWEDYHDKLDEKGEQRLNTLKTLARRMEGLIQSLLDYSMLSRKEMNMEPSDLNTIVEDVRQTLQIWLKDHNVCVEIPRELPSVICDPVQVGEVFRNLIVNGGKYNNSEDKKVEIGYELQRNQNASSYVFYVKDNGIGIPPEHAESVFKIFKRLHGREEYGGGTGAGLTLIMKIIERHGGKIWFESEEGQGTTFFFTLARSEYD